MMQLKQLKKGDFKDFIAKIKKSYEVIAPVEKDIIEYSVIVDDEIIFKRPVYPPKKFFFPPKEVLLMFEKDNFKQAFYNKKRIFFMSRCDLNGILQLDKFMLREPVDTYYENRRQNSLFVEFFCEEPGEFCFCGSMELEDFFDLRIFEKEDVYVLEPRTDEGVKLIRKLQDYEGKVSRDKKFKKKLNTKNIKKLDKNFFSRLWKKYSKECLMCTACTVMCPTCACFHVKDETELDITKGRRVREWSSCQNPNYTEVAGNHLFRNTLDGRAKHRIFCKLVYFDNNFGFKSCTGCGRCIKECPAGMDFVKEINKLK